MRFFRGAKSGERCDPAGADRRHRRDARADRLTVKMHGAGAALRQPAAEMRIIQIEIVAQHIEKRRVRVAVTEWTVPLTLSENLSLILASPPARRFCCIAWVRSCRSCRCRLVAKQADWEQGLPS